MDTWVSSFPILLVLKVFHKIKNISNSESDNSDANILRQPELYLYVVRISNGRFSSKRTNLQKKLATLVCIVMRDIIAQFTIIAST